MSNCEPEYADDALRPFDDGESLQLTMDKLARAVTPFSMCFAPSKCEVIHQDGDSHELLHSPSGPFKCG